MNWQCVSIISNCVIAVMAILAFVYNAINSSKKYEKLQSEFSKLQTDFDAGQLEIEIRNMISSARNNYLVAAKDIAQDNDDKLKKQILKAFLEDLLNSYDEACAKYIDGKIDKERFKKMYFDEIRQIVENSRTKQYYDAVSTRYKATVKVYKEWNDLENNT